LASNLMAGERNRSGIAARTLLHTRVDEVHGSDESGVMVKD